MAQAAMERIPKEETVSLRNKHIGRSCELFFRQDPLKIVCAKGQYMFNERGDRYLDCINNVAHVGHCNDEVVAAGHDQALVLNTNNRFLHDNLVLCAKKLTSLFPDPLSVCFFVNSGSEANDLALRLARTHTRHYDVVTLNHAYHGHLSNLIEISPYKMNTSDGSGQSDWVHVAPCPDTYRGIYRSSSYDNDEDMGLMYAKEVGVLLDKAKDRGRKVAAFIAESLLSCGGQIILPENYLKNVYRQVRAAGGVCIADEVQVGFGRVGRHWWAFQLQDVVPDIVTLGKPMGNGHPIAAVVTTEAIARSFYNSGIGYFNTYGGNPVSCAIALSVMEVIEKKRLRENATKVGLYLLNSCNRLAQKHSVIGDVRGVGLFIGLDLVIDRISRKPASELALYIIERMKNELILVARDGPHRNVLKLKPPMVFTNENVDHFIQILDKILNEVEGNVGLYTQLLGDSELDTQQSMKENEMSDGDDGQVAHRNGNICHRSNIIPTMA